MIDYIYVPVLITDRMPPIMQWVPLIDSDDNIVIGRNTEYGFNMRDGGPVPSSNNKLIAWLEKIKTK